MSAGRSTLKREERAGSVLVTTLTHSGQPEGPLAEPASLSAPGWPHRQQQAHSTADVWLVVWPGLLVGFFCSERFLKSESGFSLSLGHESLPLGLERGRRGGRPYATGAPSHSGPPATKVRIRDRLPSHTRFQARSRYLIFPPAQELHKVRIDSASPSLVPTPKLLSFSFPDDQGCSFCPSPVAPSSLSAHQLYIRPWRPLAWVAAVTILAIHLLLLVALSHSTSPHSTSPCPDPRRSFSKQRSEHASPLPQKPSVAPTCYIQMPWMAFSALSLASTHFPFLQFPKAHTPVSCRPNIRLFAR